MLEVTPGYILHHEEHGDPVSTIKGPAYRLGHGEQVLNAGEAAHPEFHNAQERLRGKQGKLLQVMGLTGKLAAPITKLLLSANHGMAEKSEQKQEQSAAVEVRIRRD